MITKLTVQYFDTDMPSKKKVYFINLGHSLFNYKYLKLILTVRNLTVMHIFYSKS